MNDKHQTSDISSIVQEIVDRGGWASGNSMVLIVEGSGKRVAEAYDGESANAPLLVIEYIPRPRIRRLALLGRRWVTSSTTPVPHRRSSPTR